MRLAFASIAVNYTGTCPLLAAHRDCQAVEVNIPIAGAGVDAVSNDYLVAVVGIVNCCLYIVEISGAVVVNGYCASRSSTSNRQKKDRHSNPSFWICSFHIPAASRIVCPRQNSSELGCSQRAVAPQSARTIIASTPLTIKEKIDQNLAI
jgi:hypothetical protein